MLVQGQGEACVGFESARGSSLLGIIITIVILILIKRDVMSCLATFWAAYARSLRLSIYVFEDIHYLCVVCLGGSGKVGDEEKACFPSTATKLANPPEQHADVCSLMSARLSTQISALSRVSRNMRQSSSSSPFVLFPSNLKMLMHTIPSRTT